MCPPGRTPAFRVAPSGRGLPEQGMEEGRQRKQELEQAAHQVLPQALRTLLLATGQSRSHDRWPCLFLVPRAALRSPGGP